MFSFLFSDSTDTKLYQSSKKGKECTDIDAIDPDIKKLKACIVPVQFVEKIDYSLTLSLNKFTFLEELNISCCNLLKVLYCYGNNFRNFSIESDSLTVIIASNSSIGTAVINCKNLLNLDISNNKLINFNIKTPTLECLNCENNLLESLPDNLPSTLISLICNNNKLSKINISHLEKLQLFYCFQNYLTMLPVKLPRHVITLPQRD